MRGRARRRTLGADTRGGNDEGYWQQCSWRSCSPRAASAVAAEPAAPYTIDVVALTGPQGGDLIVELDATDGSAVPGVFEHIHVKLHRPGAEETEVVNLNDVPAPNGAATVDLGPLQRGTAVEVQAQVRDEKPPRIVVLHEETTALLRPDLVVEAVKAPCRHSTEPVDVVADLVELNGDVGAKATVELWLGPTPVAEAKTVTVAKGGSLSVAFDGVSLTSAMTAELTVVVKGAAPFETDDTNNSRARTIEVTEHELVRSRSSCRASAATARSSINTSMQRSHRSRRRACRTSKQR